jgi:hypothetical protein
MKSLNSGYTNAKDAGHIQKRKLLIDITLSDSMVSR